MNLQRYPKYKSISAKWLGDVPEHWEIKRLKFALPSLESGVSVNADNVPTDDEYPGVLKTSCVYGNRFRPTENKRVVEEDLDRLSCVVTADSLIISRMNTPELVGSSGHVEKAFPNLYLPDRLWIARFPVGFTVLGRYAWYLVASHAVTALAGALATGTSGSMKNLSQEAFLDICVAVPSLPEQQIIVRFLDKALDKIDALIAKKQALIERLSEKRDALISRSVTKGLPPDAARAAGLNPHPELKSSGIEWLGDVPKHWQVLQLKWAVMFQRGHDLPADEREEGRVPVVSSSGISATHSKAIAQAPGIVTGRYGTIGQFYRIEEDYWPLNTTLYSTDLRGNEPRFLKAMLTNLSALFLLNAVKSAVPGVDRNDIHPVTTALPPRSEQKAIADYLDKETVDIDRMVVKIAAAIERLQEYRIALSTAAVTGKIDVRGA